MKFYWYAFVLLLLACNPKPLPVAFTDADKKQMVDSVTITLHQYFTDIEKEGFTAEFNYLDSTDEFFWVPPGFKMALSYDSVKASIQQNSTVFTSVKNTWTSLKVYAISPTIASYNGIIDCHLTDTAGHTIQAKLIETGTLIKRNSGWKLLCGQTSMIE